MSEKKKLSRTENVLKNSGAGLFLKVGNIFMKFVIRTVFIYYLGKEYTGVSTLFTDILQVMSLFDLGISNAMIFALYRPIAEKDSKKVSALMNFYKKAYSFIGVLIIISGFILVPFLNNIVTNVPNIKEDIRVIFLLYVITTASSYFLVYKSSLLTADQRVRVIHMVDGLILLIESIIEVILIMIFRDFILYLLTHLIFVIIRNIWISMIATNSYREVLSFRNEKLSKDETKSMFKNVFALGIYKVSGVIIYSTDSIVISAFMGTANVAIIGSYNLIVNSIRQMIESIAESTKSSIGNLALTASSEKQRQIFDKMNFIAFWGATFCSTCFFVLLTPFVSSIWFDGTFKLGLDIIALTVINFYIAIMVYPVEAFRTGNGLFIQGKYRPAVMAILNIVFDIILIQYWGIMGVLLATFLSRLFTQVWYDAYLIYSRIFKKSVWIYLKDYFIKFLIMVGISALGYLLANSFTLDNKYIDFILKGLIAAILSNGILYIIYRNDSNFITLVNYLLKIKKKLLKK